MKARGAVHTRCGRWRLHLSLVFGDLGDASRKQRTKGRAVLLVLVRRGQLDFRPPKAAFDTLAGAAVGRGRGRWVGLKGRAGSEDRGEGRVGLEAGRKRTAKDGKPGEAHLSEALKVPVQRVQGCLQEGLFVITSD